LVPTRLAALQACAKALEGCSRESTGATPLARLPAPRLMADELKAHCSGARRLSCEDSAGKASAGGAEKEEEEEAKGAQGKPEPHSLPAKPAAGAASRVLVLVTAVAKAEGGRGVLARAGERLPPVLATQAYRLSTPAAPLTVLATRA
jgi:hypothetical protein